eukprot:364562-Chlamydomonas_euryale.AAC.3
MLYAFPPCTTQLQWLRYILCALAGVWVQSSNKGRRACRGCMRHGRPRMPTDCVVCSNTAHDGLDHMTWDNSFALCVSRCYSTGRLVCCRCCARACVPFIYLTVHGQVSNVAMNNAQQGDMA